MRLRMQFIAAPLIALALYSPAHASNHPIDKAMDTCLSTAKGTGVTQCIQLSSELWEKEVAKKLKGVLSKASLAGRKDVEASQAKWIAYRDAEFAAIDSLYRGRSGDLNGVLKIADRTEVLKARALQLTSYAVLLTSIPEQ